MGSHTFGEKAEGGLACNRIDHRRPRSPSYTHGNKIFDGSRSRNFGRSELDSKYATPPGSAGASCKMLREPAAIQPLGRGAMFSTMFPLYQLLPFEWSPQVNEYEVTLKRPGAGLSTGSGTVGGARVIPIDQVRPMEGY